MLRTLDGSDSLFPLLCRIGEQFNSAFLITNPNLENEPIIFVNNAFTSLTGFTVEEVINKNIAILFENGIHNSNINTLKKRFNKDLKVRENVINYKKNGIPFWNDFLGQAILDDDGQHRFNIYILSDITKEQIYEKVIKLEQQIFDSFDKGLGLSEILQLICYKLEKIFPRSLKFSILQICDDVIRIHSSNSLPNDFLEITKNTYLIRKDIENAITFLKQGINVEHIQNSILPDDLKEILLSHELNAYWSLPITNNDEHIVAAFVVYLSEKEPPSTFEIEFIQIISQIVLLAFTNEKNQKQIRKIAYIDPLSGISNYNYFIEQFSKLIEGNSNGFVLLLQPSEYANIVDVFGKKQLGVLQFELSNRVRTTLNEIPHIVSRVTEASLIVAGFCEEEEIEKYLNLLLETVNEPIVLNGIDLYLTLKIGAVSLKYFKGNIDDFVRLADISLSYTKKHAGNSIILYEDKYGNELQKKMEIQNGLVYALRNKEIQVYLQPKVNIQDGKIVSFEALARWKSDKLGQVPPNVFIEAAENIGKIEELDFLIIEQVLKWLSERKKKGLKLYQVSVNISPNHFYSKNFVESLVNFVKKFDINPFYIKIELTENIGLVDLNRAKSIIHELTQFGFESSVDDFGIGYSSLSYIHQLPVNELKIDRSFINNLSDSGGNVVVNTIIQLANNMQLTAVAEGIETEEQLRMIRDMNCLYAQGFYFYKPMPLQLIDDILEQEK